MFSIASDRTEPIAISAEPDKGMRQSESKGLSVQNCTLSHNRSPAVASDPLERTGMSVTAATPASPLMGRRAESTRARAQITRNSPPTSPTPAYFNAPPAPFAIASFASETVKAQERRAAMRSAAVTPDNDMGLSPSGVASSTTFKYTSPWSIKACFVSSAVRSAISFAAAITPFSLDPEAVNTTDCVAGSATASTVISSSEASASSFWARTSIRFKMLVVPSRAVESVIVSEAEAAKFFPLVWSNTHVKTPSTRAQTSGTAITHFA